MEIRSRLMKCLWSLGLPLTPSSSHVELNNSTYVQGKVIKKEEVLTNPYRSKILGKEIVVFSKPKEGWSIKKS